MSVELIVVYDNMPEFIARLPKAAAEGLDVGLQAIEDEAKRNTPVATGALQASGYRITPITNTYNEAVASMRSLSSKAEEVEQPSVNTLDGEGVVGFAANYALPVHDGHHTRSGSFVAGHPFLAQADILLSENVKLEIEKAIDELASMLSFAL